MPKYLPTTSLPVPQIYAKITKSARLAEVYLNTPYQPTITRLHHNLSSALLSTVMTPMSFVSQHRYEDSNCKSKWAETMQLVYFRHHLTGKSPLYSDSVRVTCRTRSRRLQWLRQTSIAARLAPIGTRVNMPRLSKSTHLAWNTRYNSEGLVWCQEKAESGWTPMNSRWPTSWLMKPVLALEI